MKRGRRPQEPGLLQRVVAGVAVAAGLALVVGAYELGQRQGGYNRIESLQRQTALRRALAEARRENQALGERVALLETDGKVKAEAYSRVEQRLSELQARIQQQSEDIAFYRGIVGDQQSGLRVQDFGLFPGLQPEDINLRLVLAQALRDGRRIKGTVELTVAGERGGEATELGLKELRADGAGQLNFSFRYFQNLQTDLRLPADFSPATVTVRIRPASKGVEPVEASFDWELQRG